MKNVHHGGTEDTETTINTEIAEIAECRSAISARPLRTPRSNRRIQAYCTDTKTDVAYDRSTGRDASLDHSLQDPGYSLLPCSPACSSASRFWQAVTPEPQ